ncbi:unnamed protein product [Allacma fusca]|uniref:Uncharacterized protein n=1 Tax=Allacma fusca TaxID=39272 RepID=A0A8J2NMH3_9HEXA|nr:unnamed protein product [Allacma fusca]
MEHSLSGIWQSIPWQFRVSTFGGLWPFSFNGKYQIYFKWINFQLFAVIAFITGGISLSTATVLSYKKLHQQFKYHNITSVVIPGPSERFGHILQLLVVTFGINSLRIFHIIKRKSILAFWNNMSIGLLSLICMHEDTFGMKGNGSHRMKTMLQILFVVEMVGVVVKGYIVLHQISNDSIFTSCISLYAVWTLTEMLFLRTYYLGFYTILDSLAFGFQIIKARIETGRIPAKLQKINSFFNKNGNKNIIVMRNENALEILEMLDAWMDIVSNFSSVFTFPLLCCIVQISILIVCSVFSYAMHLFGHSGQGLQTSTFVGMGMDLCTFLLVPMAGSWLTNAVCL